MALFGQARDISMFRYVNRELMGVKFSRYAPVMVYSGLVADSVVPDGLMTSVDDLPTDACSASSTSDAP